LKLFFKKKENIDDEMLFSKKGVKNVFVPPYMLGTLSDLLVDQISAFFEKCAKKKFDVISLHVDNFVVVVNNSESECVAITSYTAEVHEPEVGEVVCGTASAVDDHLVVCVSKHFKIFVKHPVEFETPKAHVRITAIKSEQSVAIVALGVQKSLSECALRCSCPRQ
jgi:hypothetical protein